MSSWTARAKAATTQTGQGGTAKTDETPVLGFLAVLAVPPPSYLKNQPTGTPGCGLSGAPLQLPGLHCRRAW